MSAVTNQTESSATLERLGRGNLFVIPLDDRRHWFRYHHLFADLLQTHLLEQLPLTKAQSELRGDIRTYVS